VYPPEAKRRQQETSHPVRGERRRELQRREIQNRERKPRGRQENERVRKQAGIQVCPTYESRNVRKAETPEERESGTSRKGSSERCSGEMV